MSIRIRWLKKQPKLSVTAAGLALVAVIGVVDYLVRPPITLGVFYLIPVLLVATAAGKMRGLLVAIIGASIWITADLLDRGTKPSTAILFCNELDRLAVLSVAALLASTVGNLNEELEHGIEQRTDELRASEKRFRQLTESIREVFWMTDLTKSQMLYVSPAYEQIWGRPCASLYAAPTSWIDAIHPDDRKRISQRAMTNQASNEYDEEYRILRPDGSIRWIHDRAFPITNDTGAVYRIAGLAEDITERKLAEIRFATLAHAVGGTGELICITDLQDRFVFANQAFQKVHGYTEAEILGKKPEILYSPRNPPSLLAEVLEQTRLGGWRGEVLDRRKDGTEFPIRLSTSLVKDSTGQVIGLMGVAQDITEQKLAEIKVATLAHAVESTSELICITDLQNRFTFVNRAFQKAYGYTEPEILGKTPETLFSPRNAPSLIAEILVQARLGGWRGEVLDRRKDGSEFPIRLSTSVVKDQSGQVIGLMGVAQDITERKLAEHTLQESQQQLMDILDNTTAAIYVKDLAGGYILANRYFESIFHVKREELVGKTDFDLFTMEQATVFQQNDSQVLAASAPLEFEEVAPHDDGLHTYISIKFPLFDTQGAPYAVCGISTDITEHKRLEKEILEISDREQARIGHDLHDDLCQQLVSIAFDSNLLEKRLREKSLAEAADVHNIAHLLDESITQARMLARVLSPVGLESEGLVPALRELAISVKNRHTMHCEVDCARPVPVGDIAVATHLYRIAQEAVSNAVRHAHASRIVVGLQMLDGGITLSVTDNGIGLGDDVNQRRGMGLHTMQYRARMIDGRLEIKRAESGGTRVTCRIQVRPS
jgi:PAS domain S-box-containing protein